MSADELDMRAALGQEQAEEVAQVTASIYAATAVPGDEGRVMDAALVAPVEPATVPEEHEVLHAHLHEHADGTVHNHFHKHAGGDVPHTHGEADEHEHMHGHTHAHEHGHAHGHIHGYAHGRDHTHDHTHDELEAIPEHEHTHSVSHRVMLDVHEVSFQYKGADQPVFEGISLHAHAGRSVAILGNNGAGKSTLLNLLAHIDIPQSGTVSVGGKDVAAMGRREIAQHIAYVTQQQRIPHLSVYDEVLLGRKPHISWSITDNDRAVAAAAIERLGLEPFVNRYCDELSGGERQKVYIARALAQEPEVLLLDEPTSALDPKNQQEVMQVVREITMQASLATVMVIHDLNLALRYCDDFLLMRNGRVVSWGGIESVTEAALSETYDMPMHLAEFEGRRFVVA